MSIAENIKTLRKRSKLTQQELANRSGLNIGTIQGYEQGKYEPKQDALFKLRKALDCNIYEILDAPFLDANSTSENSIFLEIEDLELASRYKLEMHDYLTIRQSIIERQANQITTQEEPVLSIYNKLNKDGQKKVVEYASDLSQNPRYRKK